jgi:hypothetical protein
VKSERWGVTRRMWGLNLRLSQSPHGKNRYLRTNTLYNCTSTRCDAHKKRTPRSKKEKKQILSDTAKIWTIPTYDSTTPFSFSKRTIVLLKSFLSGAKGNLNTHTMLWRVRSGTDSRIHLRLLLHPRFQPPQIR